MPTIQLPDIRLYYEEQGQGYPLLCIHGTSSSAMVWGGAIDTLARYGRVIAYDRRGCSRSERPAPYDTTAVEDHADDATALLTALDAGPAIVIGRSYGGQTAVSMAIRHPGHIRALVLLEASILSLSPETLRWALDLEASLHEVARVQGVDAVAEAFLREVAGDAGWERMPDEAKRMVTANGPAILAELSGGGLRVTPSELATITQPTLLVAAADSPPAFRNVTEIMQEAIPNARTVLVGGGHLISPAEPAILGFIEEVQASA